MRLFPVYAFVLVSSLVAVACAKANNEKKKDPLVKGCVLPAEQANSLQGEWSNLPIKLSFHAGDFDSTQQSLIVSAATTWNSFYQQTKGVAAFDVAVGRVSQLAQSSPDCSGLPSDGVVIYRRSSWTKGSGAVALTTFCFDKSLNGGLNRFNNAIVEFNFQNFFVQGSNRFPDLTSVAIHEFGHLLGLDHSCGPLQNKKANVSCPLSAEEPQGNLLSTVMYPQSLFEPNGAGEVKRSLQENDQGRANCLYSD